MWVVYLVVLFGCSYVSVAHKPTIIAVAPKMLRMGMKESVTVTMMYKKGLVDVDVYLQDWPGKTQVFAKQNVTLKQHAVQQVAIDVDPNILFSADTRVVNNKRYSYLTVQATLINFIQSTRIEVVASGSRVFIQTDKPVYNPTHPMYIRVLPVKNDMTLSTETVRLEIVNPQGITISRDDLSSVNGRFIVHQFTFPKNPVYGEWTVRASYGYLFEVKSEAKFEMAEYELPRYSVKVTAPEYILPTTTEILIKISARYVFGKSVNGRYIITVGVLDTQRRIHKLGTLKGKTEHEEIFTYASSTSMLLLTNEMPQVYHAGYTRYTPRDTNCVISFVKRNTDIEPAQMNPPLVFNPDRLYEYYYEE